MRVSGAGRQPQEAAKIEFDRGERKHKYPCALPGGKAILFIVTGLLQANGGWLDWADELTRVSSKA
jgi:hypothetical protein